MIASMFYLPLAITDAAARLNFCVTTLKKACRLFGIDKWPYIKKLKRNLETMPPVAALCQTNSLLSQSPFGKNNDDCIPFCSEMSKMIH